MAGTITLVDEHGNKIGTLRGNAVGAASVTTALGIAVPNNRQMGALNTRQSKTYTVADNIRHIILTVHGVAGDACYVCFDAADDATANANLGASGGGTGANGIALRIMILYGVPREFFFPILGLRRIDAINAVATCDGLIIEGGL